MKKKVFISYANEDIRFARELESKLIKKGYTPWNYKTNMKGGQRWKEMEQLNLDLCDNVIVILSESMVNDMQRSREVWYEIRFALKEADRLPANHSFIIPVLISKLTLPDELNKYHAINFLEEGYEGIFNALEGKSAIREKNRFNKYIKYFFYLSLLISIAIIVYINYKKIFIVSDININKSYCFTIIDEYGNRIEGAKGIVLDSKSDTLVLKNYSTIDGFFCYYLDSFLHPLSVTFSHPDYMNFTFSDSQINLLNEIKMQKKYNLSKDSKPIIQSQSPSKFFSVTGFELTESQKKSIAQKCGYKYSSKGGIVFRYDFNRSKLICVDGGCRYLGDIPILYLNGRSQMIGDSIPKSPDKKLSKTEIEQMNENYFEDIKVKYQKQLYERILEFLCAENN